MPTFSVIGDVDPFLHIALKTGESVCCESDAMVSMEATLDLKGKMQGGLGRAIMRKFTQGESFFQQSIAAVRGDGECLLAPTLPGGIQVMDVGIRQYLLADGAFVCATEGVELKTKMQNLGNTLMGKTGGYLIAKSAGAGQLVVSGFGSLFELEVTRGKDVIIDDGHVVCWDSQLAYELSASTTGSVGLIRNLINSQTSGEGLVLRFSGEGKVVVCSRNRASFIEHLRKELAVASPA